MKQPLHSSSYRLLQHQSGLELLWIERVGDTESSFGNFKGPQPASLLDTYWDVPG